jgi:hypothetical protein
MNSQSVMKKFTISCVMLISCNISAESKIVEPCQQKSGIEELRKKIRQTYKHDDVMWKHLHFKEKRQIKRDLATDPSLEIFLDER